MSYMHTFKNETLQKTVEVFTSDKEGIWAEGATVYEQKELDMGRAGHTINVKTLNDLMSYWHSAGHRVRQTSVFPTLVVKLDK